MVLVGRIARPHGIRGQVIVSPETDFVETRFAVGAALWTWSARGCEQLRIVASRIQGGRPVVLFDGCQAIEDVERLAGLELRVPEEELQPLGEGMYYQHQLVGCVVETSAGGRVGDVVGVEGGAGASVLRVAGARGEVLIPLAAEICVDVDVRARRIRVDPPEGLLELNQTSAR